MPVCDFPGGFRQIFADTGLEGRLFVREDVVALEPTDPVVDEASFDVLRRIVRKHEDFGRAPGMGVQFLHAEPDGRVKIPGGRILLGNVRIGNEVAVDSPVSVERFHVFDVFIHARTFAERKAAAGILCEDRAEGLVVRMHVRVEDHIRKEGVELLRGLQVIFVVNGVLYHRAVSFLLSSAPTAYSRGGCCIFRPDSGRASWAYASTHVSIRSVRSFSGPA